ncbi:hypothetical protein CSUB01_12699, partial [Colletotrichum sublineola]
YPAAKYTNPPPPTPLPAHIFPTQPTQQQQPYVYSGGGYLAGGYSQPTRGSQPSGGYLQQQVQQQQEEIHNLRQLVQDLQSRDRYPPPPPRKAT